MNVDGVARAGDAANRSPGGTGRANAEATTNDPREPLALNAARAGHPFGSTTPVRSRRCSDAAAASLISSSA